MLFSLWVAKERKGNKREKATRGGLSLFPPSGLPLLKTTTQGPRPLCGEPRGNARTGAFLQRRTGRRPRRPMNFRRISYNEPVRAGHPAGPTHRRISHTPHSKGCGFAAIELAGRQERRPLRVRCSIKMRIRYTGRPVSGPYGREFGDSACGPMWSSTPTDGTITAAPARVK